MGVGEHPGGMIDAEFVDEVRRRFVEKFLKAFAEVSGGSVGEFLHAFNAALEIFLFAHGCAECFKPLGNLRLAEEVGLVNENLVYSSPKRILILRLRVRAVLDGVLSFKRRV